MPTKEISTQPKDWANPTPAGLTALAVACFSFFALLTGQVDAQSTPLIGLWLLGGFIIQIVVALCDIKAGNTPGGNAFLYFSAFFMFVSGSEFIMKFFCGVQGIVLDGRIDGWAWLVLTLVTYLFTPAFFKSNKCLMFVILALDVALPFIVLRDLKIVDFGMVAGTALLVSGCIAIYLAGAMIINGSFGKTILPIGKPVCK